LALTFGLALACREPNAASVRTPHEASAPPATRAPPAGPADAGAPPPAEQPGIHSTLDAARAASPLMGYAAIRLGRVVIQPGAEHFVHVYSDHDREPNGVVVSWEGPGRLEVRLLDESLAPARIVGARSRRSVGPNRVELLTEELSHHFYVHVANRGKSSVTYDALVHARVHE
jgi:hypothetical protein